MGNPSRRRLIGGGLALYRLVAMLPVLGSHVAQTDADTHDRPYSEPITVEASVFILGSLLLAALVWAIAQVVVDKRRALFVALAAFACFLIALPMGVRWKHYVAPNRRDLQRYRQNVQLVIINSGGWVAFRSEADRLLAQNRADGDFRPGQISIANDFPIINRLAPKRIGVYPLTNGSAFIKFQISGMRSTGGRGTPFYYLIVSTREVSVGEIEVGKNLHAITNRVWEAY
jgi:hypothetical protein